MAKSCFPDLFLDFVCSLQHLPIDSELGMNDSDKHFVEIYYGFMDYSILVCVGVCVCVGGYVGGSVHVWVCEREKAKERETHRERERELPAGQRSSKITASAFSVAQGCQSVHLWHILVLLVSPSTH